MTAGDVSPAPAERRGFAASRTAGSLGGPSRPPMSIAAYLTPREDVRRAFEYTRLAEELGYDSVWLTHGGGWDSVLLLTALGQATRTIGLGTGVLPIYPRHPVALAEEALTLSAVSPGRFRLGIGLSHGP